MSIRMKVENSIAEKIDAQYASKTLNRSTDREIVITENSPISDVVKASIGKKLGTGYFAGLYHSEEITGANLFGRKKLNSLASKYMNLPISDITKELRKKENVLAQEEKRLRDFLYAEREKAIKLFLGGSLTKRAIENKADLYVRNYIKGSYATEEKDPGAYKAHKQYLQLLDEFAQARAERNAVRVAKQNYIDENQDIIQAILQEEQEKRRIVDLKKSGLLAEFGIEENVEEDQEKVEEGQKDDLRDSDDNVQKQEQNEEDEE